MPIENAHLRFEWESTVPVEVRASHSRIHHAQANHAEEYIPHASLYNRSMRFTCQPGCTRCCTQDGWVYLSQDDVPRLAAFLGISEDELERRHLYSTVNTRRLRRQDGQCPFLTAEGCSVHPAKPTQCRLFPYWPELIDDEKQLRETAEWCPGIGKGDLVPVEVLEKSAREMRSAYPHGYPPA